jgi:hypothetical protein
MIHQTAASQMSRARRVLRPEPRGRLAMFTIACIITTAIVSVWLTAIARIAVKNFFLERAIKTSAYWQWRARRAEAALQEMAERHNEDRPWWSDRT